jgi:hypothetical protein
MPSVAPASRIHPLCYEHHLEMNLRKFSLSYKFSSIEEYACQKPDCFIHYSPLEGYFLDTQDQRLLKRCPIPPHQYCAKDRYPMYLLEVKPSRPSFRLWRCPYCNMSRCVGRLSLTPRA